MRVSAYLRAAAVMIAWAWSNPAGAQSASSPYIPEQLKPWVPWVMERVTDRDCARLRDGRVCVWPGRLSLNLSQSGGVFVYQVWVDRESEVLLPGKQGSLPFSVVLRSERGTEPAAVLSRGEQVYARLMPGGTQLEGQFAWKRLPKSIFVPPGAALLAVTVDGRAIEDPRVNQKSELWLEDRGQDAAAAEADAASVEVFRRLEDGVPFKMTTRLRLRISGRERDLNLGRVLPAGAAPISVVSGLNFALREGGGLSLRVRPGAFEAVIEALFAAPPETLAPVENRLPEWPADETWVWVPDEELRSVTAEGGIPVDSGRTALPDDWRGGATFIMQPGAVLTMREMRRGESEQAPNTMSLTRTLWLDPDGGGYTARDEAQLTVNRGWRLNAGPALKLGRIAVNGQDQLITLDPAGGAAGVELRSHSVSLVAESRVAAEGGRLPAVGWDQNVSRLAVNLNLPPGWTLLKAIDADQVSQSWWGRWTVLDAFLVILLAVAVGWLLGRAWGAAAGLLFILLHGESAAPALIWFHLLAALALWRNLPDCSFRKAVRVYYVLTLAVLVLVAAGYVFQALTCGLFPQIGEPDSWQYGLVSPLFGLIEGTAIGWTALLAAVWGLTLLSQRRWGRALLALLVAGTVILAGGGTLMIGGMAARKYEDGALSSRLYSSSPEQEALAPSAPAKGKKAARNAQVNLLQADPKALVQTGPGVPDWTWSTVSLGWKGAVAKDEQFGLVLLSPRQNLLLNLLRAALLLGVALAFIRALWPAFSLRRRPAAAAGTAALLLLLSPAGARADDLPDADLLNDLQTRLTADECKSDCAAINHAAIRIRQKSIEIEALVSARGAAAAALPGPLEQMVPQSIRVDGAETGRLRSDGEGYLWVRLEPGVHKVLISGHLVRSDLATLQFPVNPQHVTVDAPGWTVDGLGAGGEISRSLQFSRAVGTEGEKAGETDAEMQLAPWYLVRREFGLGLPWKIFTQVTRRGNIERPSILKLPLLSGESIASEEVKVENGLAVVSFRGGSSSVEWESTLEVTEKTALSAVTLANVSEEWNLNCSAIWRCRHSGAAPVSSVSQGENSISWKPYPGEKVEIEVARPAGAGGEAVTVDRVDYRVTPGSRLLEGEVGLTVRSSQGGFETLQIPPQARLQSVSVDGHPETMRHAGRKISLPLKPGVTALNVKFELSAERAWRTQVPAVALDHPAANVRVTIAAPPDRWILGAGGGNWGPALMFWSKLAGVLVLALLIGQSRLGGLGVWSWILLGLGTATLPIGGMAVPVVWFAWLQHRRNRPAQRRGWFNLGQIGLALLTLILIMVLYQSVKNGLVLSPDMEIRGGGSNNSTLVWYTPSSGSDLPRPWIFSAPMALWRALMLLWSTWLAVSLIRWLRWGFACFTSGGLWLSAPPKEKAA